MKRIWQIHANKNPYFTPRSISPASSGSDARLVHSRSAFIGILVIVVGLVIYGYVDIKYLQPRRPVAEVGDVGHLRRGLADACSHGTPAPDQARSSSTSSTRSTWAWTSAPNSRISLPS